MRKIEPGLCKAAITQEIKSMSMRRNAILIKKNGILFFVLLACLFSAGCKEEKTKEVTSKEFYSIDLGQDTFRIPADYLPDARNRKDGRQESVIIMGKIPGVEPLDDGASYTQFPHRTETTFRFILKEHKRKELNPDALLLHWAKQGHYKVPDIWEEEGLVHLGIFMVGGKAKNNIYAYVRGDKPIAQLMCATYPDRPNPGCTVYQLYRDHINISSLGFDIENLDWYATEGLDKILRKVESWRVKPEQE